MPIGALAVVAGLTVFLLRPAFDVPTTAGAQGPDPRVWAELLRWTDAELPVSTPVVLPSPLRADVVAAGGAEARFLPQGSRTPGALVLHVGASPPPGAAALARFGEAGGPTLTLVDPAPGEPTADELARRERLSAALLAHPDAVATGRAADVLGAADVDARLLGLLAVLVARAGVSIGDFPAAPADVADGPPARRVLLDRAGTEPLTPGSAAADRLLTFLAAQQPPFAPDTVDVTEAGVLVGFRYESAPDAVVTTRTP